MCKRRLFFFNYFPAEQLFQNLNYHISDQEEITISTCNYSLHDQIKPTRGAIRLGFHVKVVYNSLSLVKLLNILQSYDRNKNYPYFLIENTANQFSL